MNVGEWIAIAGLAVTVVSWLVRLERRFGSVLTRAEHEAICAKRDREIRDDFEHLRDDTERRHGENREQLTSIVTGVTRTHERLDDLYRDLIRERGGR